MPVFSVPPPRTVSKVYLEETILSPGFGNGESFTHRVLGSRIGIAVRAETSSTIHVGIEPYSSTGGYAVGGFETILTIDSSTTGTVHYTPVSLAVRITVWVDPSASSTEIRGVHVTDYPATGISDVAKEATLEGLSSLFSDYAADLGRKEVTTYFGGQDVVAGFSNALATIHEVKGSRIGIALRAEAACNLQVSIEPYSAASGGFQVGAFETILELDNESWGSVVYVPTSPAVRILVWSPSGDPTVEVRSLIVTDHQHGSVADTKLDILRALLEGALTTQGRVQATTYHKGSPLAGSTATSEWEIRDTADHNYFFDISESGIFDHSLWVYSTLNEPMRLWFRPSFKDAGGTVRSGPTLYQGSDALTVPANGIVCLCPKIPVSNITSGQRLEYGSTILMVEQELMREPMDVLMVRLYADGAAPTTGEIQFRHVVRY